jgi:hypothetical protein
MIVRIDIDPTDTGGFDYRVSHEAEGLFGDGGLGTLHDALVAAIEGMPPETIGAELALAGVVSGTYPLDVIALNLDQVCQHALNTLEALREARRR